MNYFSFPCQQENMKTPLLTNGKEPVYTEYEGDHMKKKIAHHRHHRHTGQSKSPKNYLVVVRSWMFLVMFSLMLGAGVILGNLINQKMNESPQVAGYQTEIGK